MALNIRQGVQRTIDIYVEDDVILKIIKLELNTKKSGSIIVSFQIMTGQYAGEIVKDYVDYEPTSKNSWRYVRLRKAAGVPYSKDEPESIDIERLLLNQAVPANLSKRTYKDKDNPTVDKTVQQVDYLDKELNVTEEELSTIENSFHEEEDKQPLPFKQPDDAKEVSTHTEDPKPESPVEETKPKDIPHNDDWPW